MNTSRDILYLEIDEEIPSVIDKLKKLDSGDAVLVVPAGASLIQSVVNVKLLKRAADKARKRLALVTTDPLGRHVASQVGVPVFVSVKDRRSFDILRSNRPTERDADEIDLRPDETAAPAGVAVHHYGESPHDEPPPRHAPLKHEPAKELGFTGHVVEVDPPASLVPTAVPEPDNLSERIEPSAESKEPLMSNLRLETSAPRPGRNRRWALIFLAVLVLAGLGVLWMYYPHVVVALTVATEPLEAKPKLIVDSSKQFSTERPGIIPGDHLEVIADNSVEVSATGTKDVGTKASGTVSLENRLGQAVKISAGTTLIGSGQTLLSAADATIPAATVAIDATGAVTVTPGKADVEVAASQSGEGGNLAKATVLSVQGLGSSVQDKVTASVKSGLSGGTSKKVTVVSQDDFDKAKAEAQDAATKAAKEKLSGQLSGKKLLEQADRVTVTSEEPSAKVDDEAEKVSVKVTVKYEALVFDEGAARTALSAVMQADVPAGKMLVLTEKDEIVSSVETVDWPAGTLTLKTTANVHIAPQIDQATIVALLKGQSFAEAEVALRGRTDIQHASFTVRPSWLPRLPNRSQAFEVTFSEVR